MIRDAYKKLYGNVEPGRALIKRTIAAAEHRAQKPRPKMRIILIPLVAILLLGFAYAATQSEFLKWVFGPVEVMPEVRELVETVGAQAQGEFASASVDEIFFDGSSGVVQWNLSTESEEPVVILRSRIWSDTYVVEDRYNPERLSVFERIYSGGYDLDSPYADLPSGLALGVLMGAEHPKHFGGATSFALMEDWSKPQHELAVLDEPAELSMTFLVLRPGVPYVAEFPASGELPPKALTAWSEKNLVQFLYDIAYTTGIRTGGEGGWNWGSEHLAPGETETYTYVDSKDLSIEALWVSEQDTLLTSLGLLDEREAMSANPDTTAAETLRWYGNLLEVMGFGEVVEEITLSIPLDPRSKLDVRAESSGESQFSFDFFRAEVLSSDFNALGGDIVLKLSPDYDRADPRIEWEYTQFSATLYRDGRQIGDQSVDFRSVMKGNRPKPWFDVPDDHVPSDIFEAKLRIGAVPEYPDTIVIETIFNDEDYEHLLNIPGDHTMAIHLREPQ